MPESDHQNASVNQTIDAITIPTTTGSPTLAEARQIAAAAYVYGYPLVSMDVYKDHQTAVPAPDLALGVAPTNQLARPYQAQLTTGSLNAQPHLGNLTYNPDSSLDIYIQNASPGGITESNWVPAPSGTFQLAMRFYWPQEAALNGSWVPPAVQEVGPATAVA